MEITQSEVRIKLGQYPAESGQPGKAVRTPRGRGPATTPTRSFALGNAYQLGGRSARRHLAPSSGCSMLDPKNGLAWENIGTSQLQSG